MKLSSVTVFYPCYNDAGTIPTMILRALYTLPHITDDYEVVVINDGSQDDSALVLDEMARLYPDHLRVIHRTQPSGYGGVLRGGFAAARKDWVFYTDGDAQYDARELTAAGRGRHRRRGHGQWLQDQAARSVASRGHRPGLSVLCQARPLAW